MLVDYNQSSYMQTSSFQKRLNKVIYDTLIGHRPLNMYNKVIDFDYMVWYHVLDMFFDI